MAKLPEFSAWQAPWEKSGTEFDAEAAKKLIYNLHVDLEHVKGQFTEAAGQRDVLQQQLDTRTREGETEVEKLNREKTALEKRVAEADERDQEALRLEVALEKGLTAVQAKRLVGGTKEELLTDADELLVSFGVTQDSDDDDDDDDPTPRRVPGRMFNPVTVNTDRQHEPSIEDLVAKIPRLGI